jgi:hypothetical protein
VSMKIPLDAIVYRCMIKIEEGADSFIVSYIYTLPPIVNKTASVVRAGG